MTDLAADLTVILPELVLAVGAMALLMWGAFRGPSGPGEVAAGAIAVLLIAGVLVAFQPATELVAFNRAIMSDGYTRFLKVLVIAAAALALILSQGYMARERLERFEYPVLVLLATTGMLVMLSANDLITLYMGLELQSLALYVLAAFNRDSARSTEAGLKYFMLGALSSGLLLYGISFVYGYTGATNFDAIAAVLTGGERSIGLLVGLVFLLAGLAFKISAVPFHMWSPDVYEGAPTPVTAFFASAAKVAAVGLLVRVLMDPLPTLMADWQQIIVFVSIASMALGAVAAIGQTNIKRLLAYSSIANAGHILVGLAPGTQAGVEGVLIYLSIYMVMTIGVFACVLAMRRGEGMVEDINELSGLARTQPMMALALLILMFSLAGIPPLAGFFGKFYVYLAAVQAGLWPLAVIGILTTVIGAFYYVRIVMIMYNGEPAGAFAQPMGPQLAVVLTGAALFNLTFLVFAAPVLHAAATAAGALGS